MNSFFCADLSRMYVAAKTLGQKMNNVCGILCIFVSKYAFCYEEHSIDVYSPFAGRRVRLSTQEEECNDDAR